MAIDLVYPEQGEIVIATVKKITAFGAFCSLDEFENQDAFIHVSEVSSGWVRNVRDHVKEGQRLVALVLRVDKIKRQIDLSIKRTSEAEKKRKMEAYNLDKRAQKLLERVAIKLGKKPDAAHEMSNVLKEAHGDLYSAFEAASEGQPLSEKIPVAWREGITAVAKVEIKPKFVVQRVKLKLKSFAPDGVEQIKKVLSALKAAVSTKMEFHYIGAPTYYIDITAPDYKASDKIIAKLQATLTSKTGDSVEFQLEKSD